MIQFRTIKVKTSSLNFFILNAIDRAKGKNGKFTLPSEIWAVMVEWKSSKENISPSTAATTQTRTFILAVV